MRNGVAVIAQVDRHLAALTKVSLCRWIEFSKNAERHHKWHWLLELRHFGDGNV
jgi:hypothetical protein